MVYEAYQEMAEDVLGRIAEEAEERFGTDRILVLHRVGELGVGEVSTAIAVATPHREEAYGASRYIIEEIKKRLPVWKQEEYVDGERAWVRGHVPGSEGLDRQVGSSDQEGRGQG
jgi:molybdopterin synthase catalytic subunit